MDAAKHPQDDTDLYVSVRRQSEVQCLIALHNELCKFLGIDKLRVLAFQIRIQDPTGLRAAASNVDSDTFLNSELKEILQRRHRNAQQSNAGTLKALRTDQTDHRFRRQGVAIVARNARQFPFVAIRASSCNARRVEIEVQVDGVNRVRSSDH